MTDRPTSTLRVLHVLEAIEGGTARHVVDLTRWVPDVEHHVAVPPRRQGGLTDERAVPAMRSFGARIHHLPMTRRPVSKDNLDALRSLVRLIDEIGPAVVHTHSSIGGVLGRLAARWRRVPVLYTPNGVTDVRAGLVVERALRPITDRFVAVSSSEATRAVELGVAPPARTTVVPNGIDVEAPATPIDLRAELGIGPGRRVVGTISRLVPQKDPLAWVAMAAGVAAARDDVDFVVIGDGDLAPEVRDAIDRAGLGPRFHLVPNLPDASRALASFDVFVLSSVFEGAPYAPMEALLAGTPVVLTDVAGSADIVDHGRNGLLVPARRPDELAAAVLRVLAEEALAERLVEHGHVVVRERFAGTVMGRDVARVYDSVISDTDERSRRSRANRRP